MTKINRLERTSTKIDMDMKDLLDVFETIDDLVTTELSVTSYRVYHK